MCEDIRLSHLTRSEFTAVQAETLSKIMSEMATREYLDAQFAMINSKMPTKDGLASVRVEMAMLRVDLAQMIERQTRWLVTLVLLLATLLGLPATLLGLLNYLG